MNTHTHPYHQPEGYSLKNKRPYHQPGVTLRSGGLSPEVLVPGGAARWARGNVSGPWLSTPPTPLHPSARGGVRPPQKRRLEASMGGPLTIVGSFEKSSIGGNPVLESMLVGRVCLRLVLKTKRNARIMGAPIVKYQDLHFGVRDIPTFSMEPHKCGVHGVFVWSASRLTPRKKAPRELSSSQWCLLGVRGRRIQRAYTIERGRCGSVSELDPLGCNRICETVISASFWYSPGMC